jgi:hypothetical protein
MSCHGHPSDACLSKEKELFICPLCTDICREVDSTRQSIQFAPRGTVRFSVNMQQALHKDTGHCSIADLVLLFTEFYRFLTRAL